MGEGKGPQVPSPSPHTQTALARATHRGRLRPGQVLHCGPDLQAEVIALPEAGVAEVRFWSLKETTLHSGAGQGEVPLPPYIHRPAGEPDRDSYQTVMRPGRGHGLPHRGPAILPPRSPEDLARQGIETVSITLHVGPGHLHAGAGARIIPGIGWMPEYFELSATAASRLNQAKGRGQRIVAVGTTSTRVLEYCASPRGLYGPQGWCDLFIYPGLSFQGGGPAAHQLPSAQIHPAAAGERLRRPGPDQAGL